MAGRTDGPTTGKHVASSARCWRSRKNQQTLVSAGRMSSNTKSIKYLHDELFSGLNAAGRV